MDMNSLRVEQSYAASRAATAADPNGASAALGSAAREFVETLQRGETTAVAAMTTGAEPHALVQALAQTELAVQTTVAVRDKVVEAYQELLRMPM